METPLFLGLTNHHVRPYRRGALLGIWLSADFEEVRFSIKLLTFLARLRAESWCLWRNREPMANGSKGKCLITASIRNVIIDP